MASRPSRLLAAVGVLVAVTSAGVLVSCSTTTAPPPTAPAANKPEEPAGPPAFADVTAQTGIAFTYRNGEEAGNYAIIESLGGGVALIDFDGDGKLDVFLPGGGHYDGKKVLGHPCKLYRNLGGWKFEDVSAAVGLDRVAFQYSHGAAAFDYDRDGWPDLLVTGYNRLVLLHNEPDGKGGRRFVDVSAKAGLKDNLWSTCAAWGDLDGDGYPDLYITHYGDWGFDATNPTDCTYDGKTRDVCQPAKFKPLPHTLYRNNRDGTFSDMSQLIKADQPGRGIGVQFVDVDNDCRPDIYVANDTTDNYLFLNRGKGGGLKLEEVGLLAGVARDDGGHANGSMGVDAADYNRSGRASIMVTNYENELPALYLNRGPGQFTFDTMRAGVSAIGGSYVSWGTGFADADLNGWPDLLIVSGHAIRFPTKIDRRQRPVLLWNDGGRFKKAGTAGWPYFGDPHNARGLAVGDLDNDGKPDLVVSHLNEPVAVLRNVTDTAGRHWLGLRLLGDKGADVVGARVVVETPSGTHTLYAVGGGSYGSTRDPRLHVGLGAETKLTKVTVHWPSGKVQEVAGLQPDAYWTVAEGDGAAKKQP